MRGERSGQGWTERLWDWAVLSLCDETSQPRVLRAVLSHPIREAPPAVAPYLASHSLCDETSQPLLLRAVLSQLIRAAPPAVVPYLALRSGLVLFAMGIVQGSGHDGSLFEQGDCVKRAGGEWRGAAGVGILNK